MASSDCRITEHLEPGATWCQTCWRYHRDDHNAACPRFFAGNYVLVADENPRDGVRREKRSKAGTR